MDEARERLLQEMTYYAAVTFHYDPETIRQREVAVTDLSALGPLPQGVSQRYYFHIGDFACTVSLVEQEYVVKVDASKGWKREELDLRRTVLKRALEHWGYGPYPAVQDMLNAIRAEVDADRPAPIVDEREQRGSFRQWVVSKGTQRCNVLLDTVLEVTDGAERALSVRPE